MHDFSLKLKKYANKYRSFFKNASVITICNIGMQIISVLGFVLISRLYTSDDIGEYVTFLAFVGILSIISTGYFDKALYIEKRKRFIVAIFKLSLVVSILVSILSFAVLSFVRVPYPLYIGFAVFATGVAQLTVVSNIANNKLIFTAVYRLVSAPVIPLAIILGKILFDVKVDKMILLNVVGLFLTSITFFILSISYTKITIKRFAQVPFVNIIATIKRYKRFFYYSMTGELVGTAALRLPTILIKNYFGSSFAAYYGMAFRILITPISLFMGTISQIFLQTVSQNKRGNVSSLDDFIKYLLMLVILGGGISFGAFIFAKPIVIFLFTNKYVNVGSLIKIMSPYMFSMFVVSPLASIITVYEKQHYFFYNKVAFLVVSLISFGIGIYLNSFFIAIKLFVVLMVLVYLIIFIEILYILFKYDVLLTFSFVNIKKFIFRK